MNTIHWVVHNAAQRGSYCELVVDCYAHEFDRDLYAGKSLLFGTSQRENAPAMERCPFTIEVSWITDEQIAYMREWYTSTVSEWATPETVAQAFGGFPIAEIIERIERCVDGFCPEPVEVVDGN